VWQTWGVPAQSLTCYSEYLVLPRPNRPIRHPCNRPDFPLRHAVTAFLTRHVQTPTDHAVRGGPVREPFPISQRRQFERSVSYVDRHVQIRGESRYVVTCGQRWHRQRQPDVQYREPPPEFPDRVRRVRCDLVDRPRQPSYKCFLRCVSDSSLQSPTSNGVTIRAVRSYEMDSMTRSVRKVQFECSLGIDWFESHSWLSRLVRIP